MAFGLVAAAPRPEVVLSTRQSVPNPIAALYPNSVTDTYNSTIAVVPIDYALARSIVPRQWGILKDAYPELLPGFPTDKYPVSHLRPGHSPSSSRKALFMRLSRLLRSLR